MSFEFYDLPDPDDHRGFDGLAATQPEMRRPATPPGILCYGAPVRDGTRFSSALLRRSHLQRPRELHPDLHGSAPPTRVLKTPRGRGLCVGNGGDWDLFHHQLPQSLLGGRDVSILFWLFFAGMVFQPERWEGRRKDVEMDSKPRSDTDDKTSW